ncbi:MAG: Kelch repeat-containing protein [Nodosilinea sp.]
MKQLVNRGQLTSKIKNSIHRTLRKTVSDPLQTFVKHLFRKRILLHEVRDKQLWLDWRLAMPCPYPLLYGAKVQLGTKLYIFGGYPISPKNNQRILILDLESGQWSRKSQLPVGFPHAYMALCTDGRHVYIAGGQVGDDGSATDGVFCWNRETGGFSRLPSLPTPRYGATMQYVDGRLHFLGGTQAEDGLSSDQHWSLAVEGSSCLQPDWQAEPPVPLPASHMASLVVDDQIYLFGGQQEESGEAYHANSYRYATQEGVWDRLADMPMPVSHGANAMVMHGGWIYILGGQVYGSAGTNHQRLTDLVQVYDPAANTWAIAGALPYRLKGAIAGILNNRLYVTTGQRDQSYASDQPGSICRSTWTLDLAGESQTSPTVHFPHLKGKKVVLWSHELSRTGAPLVLLELAAALRDSQAEVRLFSWKPDTALVSIARQYRIPVLPLETLSKWAYTADLIICNTVLAASWMGDFLGEYPGLESKILWWMHEQPEETDISPYASNWRMAIEPAQIVFDSRSIMEAWDRVLHKPNSTLNFIHLANRQSLEQLAEQDRLRWPLQTGRKYCDRQEARKALGIQEQDFLVSCLGSYTQNKGQAILIRCVGELLEQYPDLPLRLMIVGLDSQFLKQMVLKQLTVAEKKALLGGRLLLMNTADYEIFYRMSDLHVLNTQGRGEIFGRVTIEAMAFGIPVFGTSAGGTPEIIEEGVTGLLHPVGEAGPENLKANLLSLVSDREIGLAMGRAGKKRALEYFTESRQFEQFATVFDHILANQQGSDPGNHGVS